MNVCDKKCEACRYRTDIEKSTACGYLLWTGERRLSPIPDCDKYTSGESLFQDNFKHKLFKNQTKTNKNRKESNKMKKDEVIQAVLNDRANGMSISQVAKKYNVSKASVVNWSRKEREKSSEANQTASEDLTKNDIIVGDYDNSIVSPENDNVKSDIPDEIVKAVICRHNEYKMQIASYKRVIESISKKMVEIESWAKTNGIELEGDDSVENT